MFLAPSRKMFNTKITSNVESYIYSMLTRFCHDSKFQKQIQPHVTSYVQPCSSQIQSPMNTSSLSCRDNRDLMVSEYGKMAWW